MSDWVEFKEQKKTYGFEIKTCPKCGKPLIPFSTSDDEMYWKTWFVCEDDKYAEYMPWYFASFTSRERKTMIAFGFAEFMVIILLIIIPITHIIESEGATNMNEIEALIIAHIFAFSPALVCILILKLSQVGSET